MQPTGSGARTVLEPKNMSSNPQVSAEIGHRFAANQALAALITDRRPLRSPDARRVDLARIAGLPWRDLLRELRLPVRRRTLRILAKLAPDQCHPVTVRRLAQVLRLPRHPALRILPHLPRLSRDTVRLLFVPTECITARLLLASASSPEDEEPVNRVVRAIRLLRKDGRWPYRALGLIQLQAVERRLSTAAVRNADAIFPAPPFPGIPGCIVPIRDARDLLAEADGQHHCGAIYFPEVMAVLAYFYRVLRPERATLLILRAGSTAPWILGDLRLFANAEPTADTTSFVSEWLANAK